MIEKLKEIEDRYKVLSAEIIKPEVIQDTKLYSKYTKEYTALEPIVNKYDEYKKYKKDLEEATTLLNDPDLKQMAEEEIQTCKQAIDTASEELKILLLPKDENDDKNVIIEIRGGAGGEEASLFGGVLMRMYLKYAERKRFKVELISVNETELGGVKEAVFKINGKGAYSDLKFESGVHRVQRVPETESQGRIHTSTATVAVLPEQEDIDMNIDEKDLKIDICRASGAGGQHVNTTDSAVRMVHIPTGIMVYCQDGRSQLKNRELAFSILKSKVYDYYKTQSDSAYAENRRNQVGSGDRSERIRTYNYPQSRLTDHRINFTSYNLEQFLNGELDELIDALKIAEREYKLSHSE